MLTISLLVLLILLIGLVIANRRFKRIKGRVSMHELDLSVLLFCLSVLSTLSACYLLLNTLWSLYGVKITFDSINNQKLVPFFLSYATHLSVTVWLLVGKRHNQARINTLNKYLILFTISYLSIAACWLGLLVK